MLFQRFFSFFLRLPSQPGANTGLGTSSCLGLHEGFFVMLKEHVEFVAAAIKFALAMLLVLQACAFRAVVVGLSAVLITSSLFCVGVRGGTCTTVHPRSLYFPMPLSGFPFVYLRKSWPFQGALIYVMTALVICSQNIQKGVNNESFLPWHVCTYVEGTCRGEIKNGGCRRSPPNPPFFYF